MDSRLHVLWQEGEAVIYLYIFAGLIILFFLWSFLEQKIIVKTEYNIEPKEPGILTRNFTFVVISDLHNTYLRKNYKVLLQKIFAKDPDFVIIAGDLITKRKPCYPSNAYKLIKELSDKYPVYYAYGNHEQAFEDLKNNADYDIITDKENQNLYNSWELYKEKLNDLGVYLLDNKSIIIKYKENSLTITGLSIDSSLYKKGKPPVLNQEDIFNKIGNRSKEGYQILIAHNPVYFKEYVGWGADLVLSGHVHGGLVRIPFIGGVISPQLKLFPKYDAGLFAENGQYMVISRGLGNHSFMPRFLNPPELVVINLKAK